MTDQELKIKISHAKEVVREMTRTAAEAHKALTAATKELEELQKIRRARELINDHRDMGVVDLCRAVDVTASVWYRWEREGLITAPRRKVTWHKTNRHMYEKRTGPAT
jgi:hypothetical protein